MLELVLSICNQETALELKRRWMSSVKHRKIISNLVSCVGKQCPVPAQLLLENQKHVQGALPSCRFLSWLSSWLSQFSSSGWKELMAVPCHHFFLSKSQFGNSSEIISCRWWGASCYPTVSLGPCTCALKISCYPEFASCFIELQSTSVLKGIYFNSQCGSCILGPFREE